MTHLWDVRPAVLRWATVIAFLAFAFLRVEAATTVDPFIFPDSADYTYMAKRGVMEVLAGGLGTPLVTPQLDRVGGDFPLIEKPPATALFFKLLGNGANRIVWGQALVGSATWGLLALAVARCFEGMLARAAAYVGVLLVGLTEHVAVWDAAVLSDSLSMSGLAATIAALLFLRQRWSRPRLAALVISTAVYGLTRDVNALLLLGVLLTIGTAIAAHRVDRRWLAVVAALGLVFGVSAHGAFAGHRGLVPLYHVISKRVLPEASLTAGLADQGMPDSARLRGMEGRSVTQGFGQDPSLRAFHEWIAADGQRAYLELAIRRPRWALVAPFGDLAEIEAAPRDYRPPGYAAPVPTWLSGWVVASNHVALALHGSLAVLAMAIGRRRRAPWLLLTCASLWGATLAVVLANWHGDGNEFGRHAKDALVLVALGAVLGISAAIDTPRQGAGPKQA